jgi:predicted ABC-type ATPase
MHVERVKARADAGGHSGSEPMLCRIYDASLMNLLWAVQELDVVWVYDNTAIDASHSLVLEARNACPPVSPGKKDVEFGPESTP